MSRGFITAIVVGVAMLGAADADYAIDWYTMDGGGGTSTGEVFTLSGTVGQPDAAPPASGTTTLIRPGFWPGVIQWSMLPVLMIQPAAAGQVLLSWEASGVWRLQISTDLVQSDWQDAPTTTTNPAVIQASEPVRLFRLIRELTPRTTKGGHEDTHSVPPLSNPLPPAGTPRAVGAHTHRLLPQKRQRAKPTRPAETIRGQKISGELGELGSALENGVY